jgi:hypothetical protein
MVARWDGAQTGFDVDADSLLEEMFDDLLHDRVIQVSGSVVSARHRDGSSGGRGALVEERGH